jgi:hypothetical protein
MFFAAGWTSYGRGGSDIAKSDITLELEKNIWEATYGMGTFGCFEVTIGWFGNERVDFLTYDTKGTWRCYEIKANKADFYSNAALTFIGHFNYFVMPEELFEQVKNDIPAGVGVYANGKRSVKRARRQSLKVDEKILTESLIRSLYREADKLYQSGKPSLVDYYRKKLAVAERQAEKYRRGYWDMRRQAEDLRGGGK